MNNRQLQKALALNYLLTQMVNRDYIDEMRSSRYGILETIFSAEEETESIEITHLQSKSSMWLVQGITVKYTVNPKYG